MLLGIETAAEVAGVALAGPDGPLAWVVVHGERRHADVLPTAICHVLEQAGVPVGALDAVAVDVGPGLFTGLRVGVATAQGLAQGLGVGVVAVTSTAVLARGAYDAGWDGPVAAVVDARRGEVFCARYSGPDTETHPPARWSPEGLAAELTAVPGVLVVGGGARRHGATFAGLRVALDPGPSPRALVEVAAARLAAGEPPVRPADVRPVYLRDADARINWTTR